MVRVFKDVIRTYIDETMGIARASSGPVPFSFMRNETYTVKNTNEFRELVQNIERKHLLHDGRRESNVAHESSSYVYVHWPSSPEAG